jgi:hypothetical protein
VKVSGTLGVAHNPVLDLALPAARAIVKVSSQPGFK